MNKCATFIACILILFGFASCFSKESSDLTEAEIRRQIQIGDPLLKVQKQLSSLGVEYSLHAPTNKIYAVTRTKSSRLVKQQLQIVIELNDKNEVAKIVVSPVFTGP